MTKYSCIFLFAAALSGFFVRPQLIAQTDLMQDVDAVKEKNDDDLYAPDDEAPGASVPGTGTKSVAKPSATTPRNAPPPPAPAPIPTGLDDLPVSGGAPARPNSALTGVDNTETAELTAIRIYSLDDRVRYEVQTSRVVDYAPETSSQNQQFILNLANTTLGPLVSKGPIRADEYGGPVKQIQSYEQKSSNGVTARVVMNLSTMTDPIIRREGNRLLVDFYTRGAPGRPDLGNNNPEIPSNYESLISLNNKTNFVGTKVNFKSKDAAIPDVLQFLSQVSGKNFVLAGESEKKISMNVKGVPWDQVLALVLLNADLGYQKLGNTYRVMPVTKIRQEISDAIKAQDDEDKLQPKATQLFPLSYAKTTDVVPQVTKLLKADYNESVVQDDRTNSIVVTALPKNIQRIRRYIEAIDKQTPVIQIEARIVQAKKDFSREIGIDWKALGAFSIGNGTLNIGGALGNATSSTGSIAGGTGIASGSFSSLGATGGAFGNYANDTGTLRQLDAFLKFTETNDTVRELSRPSLTVLNNKKANIVDGTEITLLVPSGSGGADTSSTKTVRAALSLTVTPQVTNDNNILLDLLLTRDSFGAAPSSVTLSSLPIDKREISTQTLVESGKTVVIGGVYIKENENSVAGWPFFRKIPIFGTLLTSTDAKHEAERELLMFISPRILNLEKASVYGQSLEDAR